MKAYVKLEVRIEMPVPLPDIDTQRSLALAWVQMTADMFKEIIPDKYVEVAFDDAQPFVSK